MLRAVLLAAALLALAPTAGFAQIVEVEGRYWLVDLDASARVNSGSSGTRVDLSDDLGLDDQGVPDLRLTFFPGFGHRIRLAYTRLEFDGDTTLDDTILFEGTTFPINTAVSSELDIHYARVGWAWQFPIVPTIVQLGPLVELKGFLVDATIRSRGVTPQIRESETFGLALPTIGAALDITPHRTLHLFAEASGLPAGDLGHIVDAEAGVKFVPFPNLTISASYRFFDARVEDGSDFVKLRLAGPAFGLSLRF